MTERERPPLEEAMETSPRHRDLVWEGPHDIPRLRRKDRWSFKRTGVIFIHDWHSLEGLYDQERLFFDEPDPDKRHSPKDLLVGQLTLPYATPSYYLVDIPEEPKEEEKHNALIGVSISKREKCTLSRRIAL